MRCLLIALRARLHLGTCAYSLHNDYGFGTCEGLRVKKNGIRFYIRNECGGIVAWSGRACGTSCHKCFAANAMCTSCFSFFQMVKMSLDHGVLSNITKHVKCNIFNFHATSICIYVCKYLIILFFLFMRACFPTKSF